MANILQLHLLKRIEKREGKHFQSSSRDKNFKKTWPIERFNSTFSTQGRSMNAYKKSSIFCSFVAQIVPISNCEPQIKKQRAMISTNAAMWIKHPLPEGQQDGTVHLPRASFAFPSNLNSCDFKRTHQHWLWRLLPCQHLKKSTRTLTLWSSVSLFWANNW